MPNFEATIALGGKTSKVKVTADSRNEAMRILKRQGRVTRLRRESLFDMSPALSQSDRYVFLVKLATMVGSKVPMGKALTLMAETFSGNIRRISANMADRVNTGVSFIAAMEAERKSFPATIIELVRAGFSAGNAANALREAAEFEQLMQNIKKGSMKDVNTGFGYMVASAALTWGTMVWFGPMVTDNPMFGQAGVSTQWIEDLGWLFLYFNLLIVFVMIFLVFFGTVGRLINPAVSDRLIARIPYYSDLVLAKNNYLTFYKMSLLIRSGVRVEGALELVGRDAPRGALKSDFLGALANIRSGRAWPDAMESLDPTDRASLKASSDARDIAGTFLIMAEQFRDIYIARIQTLGPMLNIVAALFMSIASALMFGLTILPMLQLSANI